MSDRAQVTLWKNLRLCIPIIAFVLPYPIARLLGGFGEGFQFIDHEVSPAEAFGILGTMLLPIAAWAYATMRLEQTLAVLSRSWPTVPGKIDRSDISEKLAYRSGRYWALGVRYTYHVGGVTYVGTRLAFAPRWINRRDTIDNLARRYAVGASVDVRYDPDQPDQAVLETDDQLATQRLFAVWVCVLVVAVGVIVMTLAHIFP
jgi:Protein of unknown function (DUF3592)